MAPVRVLVVDDSALARRALVAVLSAASDICVIGTAADPFQAAAKLREAVPDVILLDLEMPRLDGLSFLRRLMQQHPVPTIICSSFAQAGSPAAIAALEAGAVDIIEKPQLATQSFFEESALRIHDAVRAAAKARVRARAPDFRNRRATVDEAQERSPEAPPRASTRVIAVGTSTGGTDAIRTFLEYFDRDAPGIVIVQHISIGFTASLARRLDQVCRVRVKEAEHGDLIESGRALIAPAGRHMTVRRNVSGYAIEIADDPPVNRHRPSVDVLFHSVARTCGASAVGVIMTGMGDDGARGLKAMRDAGARTFGQDEATCIVYGMPREASRCGAVEQELPLGSLADAALAACD